MAHSRRERYEKHYRCRRVNALFKKELLLFYTLIPAYLNPLSI